MTAEALDRDRTVYIAGHHGLAGSAIWRRMSADGFGDLRGLTSSELDLREREAVFDYVAETRPSTVVLAAA
jgi:GDP-L-fucose synthase